MPTATIAEIDAVVAGATAPGQLPDHSWPRTPMWPRCTDASDAPGPWQVWTFQQYAEQVARAAAGLLHLGVAPGERVLLMMRNRPDFHWFDLAAQFLRATPVSIYNSSSPEEMQYLAHHAEAEIAIVEDAGFLERLLEVRDELPALRHIFVIDPPAGGCPDGVLPASELLDHGPADLAAAGRRHVTRRHRHADLHQRHHRPAEGRDDQPVQRRVHGRVAPSVHRLRRLRRQASRELPADGAHRRADDEPLPGCRAGLQRVLLPRCRPAVAAPHRRAPAADVRRAAGVGEDPQRRQRGACRRPCAAGCLRRRRRRGAGHPPGAA